VHTLTNETFIARLRVSANAADPQAAASRAAAALRSLELQPPGLAAQSILCVRELRDPLPGGIDVRSTWTRPTQWEAAMRSALSQTLSRAVRPALGPVSSSVDAVLFADRAELLACAARDACRGPLDAWWWRHLVRGLSLEHVISEWLRSPAYVPAAFELLLSTRDAMPFVQRLEKTSAVDLTVAALRAHCAESIVRTIGDMLENATATPAFRDARVAELFSQPRVAWRTIVPELIAERLTIEQHIFATICLMLRRAPQVITRPSFAQELAAWIEVQLTPHETALADQRHPPVPRAVEQSPPLPTNHHVDIEASRSDAEPTASNVIPIKRLVAASIDRTEITRQDRAIATRQSRHLDVVKDNDNAVEERREPPPRAATVTPKAPIADAAITSAHGGLFFLLKIAVALGYYGDSLTEATHPLDLNIWDFLAMLGRAIEPSIVDDPVWPLLEQLANRTEPLHDIDGFVEKILTPVEECIALTLDKSAQFLVSRTARIALTPAHIDVAFTLMSHPIEIRMAGLDRDPGWIPAAGRYVSFHFD
jgi:hypothetical protein